MLSRWYQDELVEKINTNPDAIFTVAIDKDISGVWHLTLKVGIEGIGTILATPFYDGIVGIPLSILDNNEQVVHDSNVSYYCTGNVVEDAAAYVVKIGLEIRFATFGRTELGSSVGLETIGQCSACFEMTSTDDPCCPQAGVLINGTYVRPGGEE